ncbi:hypothetical protein PHMEG_0008489 [Phytophthora megakarya]|uniref:Uncharacterized protein n=1 Tax=Phytophthora megakarya TaxID=4795 RepID=A0A225WKB0_9STRA|nr:hypothetical protein PHMEG_0008489 [Phytophthora megakarya]
MLIIQGLLAKFQLAVISSQPVVCRTPSILNGWDINEASTPAAGTTRSKTRLMYE